MAISDFASLASKPGRSCAKEPWLIAKIAINSSTLILCKLYANVLIVIKHISITFIASIAFCAFLFSWLPNRND